MDRSRAVVEAVLKLSGNVRGSTGSVGGEALVPVHRALPFGDRQEVRPRTYVRGVARVLGLAALPVDPFTPKLKAKTLSSRANGVGFTSEERRRSIWYQALAAGTMTGVTDLLSALTRPAWRRRFWTPAVEAAGLTPLRPHDLRHTAVALWIASGANPLEVSRRAGHVSTSFTQDRYGHLFPEADRALAERLELFVAHAAAPRSSFP